MKKLFIALTISVSIISSAFASDATGVNTAIRKEFVAQFGNVEKITWAHTGQYVTATFVEDSEQVNAHFDRAGNLIGTSKAVATLALPPAAKRALAKKYDDYLVTEAIEFNTREEQAYFIAVEKGTKKMILKICRMQVSIFKTIAN